MLTGASAQAIELTDYVDPVSDYDAAFLDGSFDYSAGAEQAQPRYDIDLSASYERQFSTLPRTWSTSAQWMTAASRGSDDGAVREEDTTVQLSAAVDNYLPNSAYAFWFGSASAALERRTTEDDNSRFDLSSGMGYGRVFDATPLAKVLRLEEELRSIGTLRGKMGDDVYLELSKIVAKESEYQNHFTTGAGIDADYKAEMVTEIERALKRAELIDQQAGLGALGSLRISETLFEEQISARAHGWVVRAGVAYTSSELEAVRTDEPALKLQWRYEKPYGHRGQLSNQLAGTVGERRKSVQNTLRYTYEISDTLDWENSWSALRSEDDAASTTSHSLDSRYQIQLAQQIYYDVGLRLTWLDAMEMKTDFTMGVRYRLK